MRRFEGRVALVTGAASGIGRATVLRLASEGAGVVAVDIEGDGLDATAAAVDATEDAGAVRTAVLDVRTIDAASRAVDLARDEFGRLDVLANVAGVLRFSNTHEVPDDEWDFVIAVNLTGAFRFCRAALPVMVEAGGGSIVNVSSTAALAGHPWAAAYAASKGGLLALTRTIAVEYGKRGVRANAVAPGGIDTPMSANAELPADADLKLVRRLMPLDRFRGPETVASTIAFLASDDASHVSGEVVRVDGATLA